METLTKQPTSKNVEKANKQESLNKELIERYQIPESPFTVITMDEVHFGVMGEYRMTENYNTRKECVEALEKITWNRMIQVVLVLNEIVAKDKEFQKELKTKLKTK